MHDLNHAKLRYQGQPGEAVTVDVIAHDTNHMVQFSLDGNPPQVLSEGESINFNLKSVSGAITTLKLILDFNAMGTYEMTVTNVSDCPETAPPECTHTRSGPDQAIENFRFGVI